MILFSLSRSKQYEKVCWRYPIDNTNRCKNDTHICDGPMIFRFQDSDTEGSDVETLNTATHDKVSIDEQLFEYLDKVCSLLTVALIYVCAVYS